MVYRSRFAIPIISMKANDGSIFTLMLSTIGDLVIYNGRFFTGIFRINSVFMTGN